MKTLVIGLGNPLLSDDGVGWEIVRQVQRILPSRAAGRSIPSQDVIEYEFLGLGGLSLMEHLIGYDRAILVDAIHTGSVPCGKVSYLTVEDLEDAAYGHLSSAHDVTFGQAMQIGARLGADLPHRIDIVAVEAQHVYDFSELLSPPVAAAVPEAVQQVLWLIENGMEDDK